MPLHFKDLDVMTEVEGLSSVLIVPCIMCPAVTVSIREKKPFLQFFRSLVKSPPLDRYLKNLQSRLREKGIKAKIFNSYLFHQWFMCIWTERRRRKLQRYARRYDAVIVYGCESGIKTIRDALESTNCKVIEGMEATAITNARPSFHWPCNISFEGNELVPICKRSENCPYSSKVR